MLCRECGVREVPPRQGTRQGRARTKCLVCQPPLNEEQKERARLHQRLARERARLKALRGEANYATALCGCDRDYLTVPLEDAHRCPAAEPLPTSRPGMTSSTWDPERAERWRAAGRCVYCGGGFCGPGERCGWCARTQPPRVLPSVPQPS